jgi:hypothetical protein
VPAPLYLHVGLPKSGTTFLQAVMADNRARLKEAGFVYPFIRRECMFHAAVELRQQHDRWGLRHELIDGTWDKLLTRVREFGGTGIISHELFAGAQPEAVERVARDTADLDLHIVVTARDLGRQAAAHWQEEVKNGRRWSFEDFHRSLFRDKSPEDEEVGFWRTQDLLGVLRRWATIVPEQNVHLVVVPQTGADPWELWRRFSAAIGLDPDSVDLQLNPRANESLGAPQVALLRQVNAALDGRLGQPHYAHVVKRFFAQGQLAAVDAPRAVAPPELCTELDEVVRGWLREIRAAGWSVHGDPAELMPGSRRPTAAPHPDDITPAQMIDGLPEVLAAMLMEIAELRTRVTGPKRLPPIPVPEGERPDAEPGHETPAPGPDAAPATEAPLQPQAPVGDDAASASRDLLGRLRLRRPGA